jgi:hypothetical protein
VFRRRRSADAGRDWPEESGQEVPGDEIDDDEPARPAGNPRPGGGPWDADEPFPDLERVDLGSLQVPIGPEHEISSSWPSSTAPG